MLLAAGLVVLGLLFRELVTLLVGLLVTVLFAIPVAAVTDWFEQRRVPRPAGALLTIAAFLAVIAGLVALILPTFIDQAEGFIDAVPDIAEDLEREVADITGAKAEEVGEEVQSQLEGIADDPAQLVGPIAAIGLGVAGLIAAIVIGVITIFYIAVRPQPLIDGALSLFPPARREWAMRVADRIRDSWIGWMKGVFVDMLANGVMIWAGLSLIGLDFAVVFGVLAGLLTVVPYFGPVVASIPALLYALADSPEKMLLVLVVYVVVQQIEGNLTIPLVMAQTVQLHPAVIAIGVVVVAQLFGFVGLFVAVPILSLIVILVDELWVKPHEAEPIPAPAGAADPPEIARPDAGRAE